MTTLPDYSEWEIDPDYRHPVVCTWPSVSGHSRMASGVRALRRLDGGPWGGQALCPEHLAEAGILDRTKENNVDNNRYYVTQDYLSGWAVEDEDGDKPVARTCTKEDAELVANALNATTPKPQFFAKDDRVYDRKAGEDGDHIVTCYSSDSDEYTAESLAKFVAVKLNGVRQDEVIG